MLEDAEPDILAFYAFPSSHWRKLRSTNPLERFNREVGRRLSAMMEMGASRPWPEALQAFTGSREMSAAPMVEYFRPLLGWLREENRGRQCGWQSTAARPRASPKR